MSRPVSRRSGAVDPFIVMDVMAAAAEKEAGRRHGHPPRGRPAQHTRAQRRDRGRPCRARQRPHGLRGGARHACLARAHRAALSRGLWLRGVGRPRDRHHRLVRRLSARLPRELRCRRARGPGGARLSRLPQHPGGAQPRGGRPADLRGRPLSAHRRGARKGHRRDRPYRRPDRGESVQSDRHDGDARRARRTCRVVRPPPRAADLRRDLSRHRLRG